MWIAPPALLPFAEVSALHVTVGVTLPAGVALLVLALTEKRATRDLGRVQWRPHPERQRRRPGSADRYEEIEVVPGRVHEGQILARVAGSDLYVEVDATSTEGGER